MENPNPLQLRSSREDNTFIGEFHRMFNNGGAYGGHTVALAAKAALLTVPNTDKYLLNSVHCLYVGKSVKGQVTFQVKKVKDGQTFCFREVIGTQKDRVVTSCLVSFKFASDPSYANLPHNSESMPSDIPTPDQSIPFSNVSNVYDPIPLDGRFVNVFELEHKGPKSTAKHPTDPRLIVWMKWLNRVESANINDYRLAVLFASDLFMPGVILKKYPHFEYSSFASLNHCVYFHGAPSTADESNSASDFNQWHLFNIECVCSSSGGISLAKSQIYNKNGVLVATAIQQGFIRAKL